MIHVVLIKCIVLKYKKNQTKKLRPKLGRSCRCIQIQGHGYESVVDCVLMSDITKPQKLWGGWGGSKWTIENKTKLISL